MGTLSDISRKPSVSYFANHPGIPGMDQHQESQLPLQWVWVLDRVLQNGAFCSWLHFPNYHGAQQLGDIWPRSRLVSPFGFSDTITCWTYLNHLFSLLACHPWRGRTILDGLGVDVVCLWMTPNYPSIDLYGRILILQCSLGFTAFGSINLWWW